MDQLKERNLRIIRNLASQISLGWHQLHVAIYLDDAFRDNKIKGATILLNNARIACLNSSVLGLLNVVVEHEQSLSIIYLFNCLKANPSSYPYISKKELLDQIKKHRKNLMQVEAILPRLRTRRDKLISHLDKKLVTQPETVFLNSELDMESLIEAYRVLRKILDVYDKQTGSFCLWLDEKRDIYKEVDCLIMLIDKHSAENPIRYPT